MNDFAAQGYQIIRGIFSAADIALFREAITETIDRVARALRTPLSTSHPDASFEERLPMIAREDRAYAAALFHAVMADAQRDERIQTIGTGERLSSAVSRALNPMTRTGHIIRTRATIPEFSAGRAAWHQDVIQRRTDSMTGCASVRVACWIPLSDVDATTGALEVVPGRWTEPFPHSPGADGQFAMDDKYVSGSKHCVVPLRLGDVLLLDRYIPHRSSPVQPGRARWAIVMWVKAGAGNEQSC